MENLRVYCADVGSIKKNKFGWAVYSPYKPKSKLETGGSIVEFACNIAQDLKEPCPVAVGFECPLFVPVRDDPQKLLEGRNGDGKHPWSAGAGTAAMAAGMVELIWVLKSVRDGLNSDISAYLDWGRFQQAKEGLFIWEAFVSGSAKGLDHCDDAKKAVEAFCAALPDPTTHNAIEEVDVFSLAVAALLRAGWPEDTGLLKAPCLVIKAASTPLAAGQ